MHEPLTACTANSQLSWELKTNLQVDFSQTGWEIKRKKTAVFRSRYTHSSLAPFLQKLLVFHFTLINRAHATSSLQFPFKLRGISNFFKPCFWMHAWAVQRNTSDLDWQELSSIVVRCSMLSCRTTFMEATPIKQDYSSILLFAAILSHHSSRESWVQYSDYSIKH